MAKTAVSSNWRWEDDFRIAYGDTVHSRDNVEVSFYENREALEEADNRMICHINDIVKITELSNIYVRTADCDVLVILLFIFYPITEYQTHTQNHCRFWKWQKSQTDKRE